MENTEKQQRKYLYGHISPETAYVVDDYPWGFRMRTKIRYWIETSLRNDGGQRFCSQTINPKTNIWCAPKKSTFNFIKAMFLDVNNHVHYDGLGLYDTIETIESWIECHWINWDDFQKSQANFLLARDKVMQCVKVEIAPNPFGPVSLFSQKPEDIEKRRLMAEHQEQHKIEQDKIKKKLCAAIISQHKKLNEEIGV